MVERRIPAAAVAQLLEQVGRMSHAAGHAEGLFPAQWVALRYFAEADAPARTVAALARFQGMSIAPVARSVRTLVDKGLLLRRPHPAQARGDLVEVSATGRELLARDPRRALVDAVQALENGQIETLAEALELIARALAARGIGSGE